MGSDGRQRKREWLYPSKWLELYTLWAYKRPLRIFLLLVGILILLVVGVIAANSFELSDTDGDEWIIKSEEQTKRDQAIEEALDDFGSLINQRPRSEDDGFLELTIIYKAKDDSKNMFTAENLEVMRKVENVVLQHSNYQDFCELNYTAPTVRCIDQQTPLFFFFDYNASNPMFGDAKQSPEAGLAEMNGDIFRNGFFVTKGFPESGNTSSLYTRSTYSFGLPVNNRTNSNEDDGDQRAFVYDGILSDLEEELWDLLGMDAKLFRTEFSTIGSYEQVEVLFSAGEIAEEEFERAVTLDFTWAVLSILVVWVYMLVHLGSFFLSLVGIFEIFMSFPAALFIYREIFAVDFFSQLNILVIFILLGIGADDVFVFTDAFKQSHAMEGVGKSLKDRLLYTAHRASKAVFVTSFTTAAAFFATAISELMPMRAFGIFAGLCIVFLFIINVLMMPVALVLWAGYTPWCVRTFCCCCAPLHGSSFVRTYSPCCTCCHISEDENFDMSTEVAKHTSDTDDGKNQSGDSTEDFERGADNLEAGREGAPHHPPGHQEEMSKAVHVHAKVAAAKHSGDDITKLRAVERFFNGKFFNFVKRARFPIIVLGAILFGVGLYYVTTFKAPEEEEDFWPSFHSFNEFNDLVGRKGPFLADDEDAFTTVHLVWGLKGMDTSGIDVWDATDFGTVIYDDEFDMTSREAQQHLLGVCPQARNARCTAEECRESCVDGVCEKFLVRFDRSNPSSFEPCWIEDMHAFIQNDTSLNGGEGLPVDPERFIPLLKEYMKTPTAIIRFQEQIGLFGDDLRFVQLELDSTFRPPTSAGKTEPVMEEWEDFMDMINEQAAASGAGSVANGFQTGRFPWVWIATQDALIDNARQGVFLVFAIAFVVLNFATGNVIISILSILSVVGIVTTVMGIGIRAIMGWDLGVAESIVSVIVIGFSLDYSLHLADAYIESERTSRMDRTQDSLTRLGISVTAGATTTLLSGLFLWGAILTFFTKFAFNITATIIASYGWSMLFFPAMCMTFGPEGDVGNWSTIINYLRSKCCPGVQAPPKEEKRAEREMGNMEHGRV